MECDGDGDGVRCEGDGDLERDGDLECDGDGASGRWRLRLWRFGVQGLSGARPVGYSGMAGRGVGVGCVGIQKKTILLAYEVQWLGW